MGRSSAGDIGVLFWAAATTGVRWLCTRGPSVVVAEGNGALKGKKLYRRLSALGGAPEGSVKRAVDQWVREGGSLTVSQIMSDVRQLRRYGRFRHALELMEWMDAKGISISCGDHAVRLHLLAKAKGINSAEKYFDNLSKLAKNHQTYGALLSIYCVEKIEDKARALLEQMKQLNYDSNKLVYNNLMTLYIGLGRPDMVPVLLQEMKAKDILRDTFTYSLLLDSYASLGDLEAVKKSMQEIEEEKTLFLEWEIYGKLASIYISAGFFEQAELSLRKLEKNMNNKDRTAFHYLISLYSKMGNLTEVNRVWKSLKSAFPRTINMNYLVMMMALDKMNCIDSLKQCFEEWSSSHTTYDMKLVNVLVTAYLRMGMRNEAELLREHAVSKCATAIHRTFEIFILWYLENHELELALNYIETACSEIKGWKPQQRMLTPFMLFLREGTDLDAAKGYVKRLTNLKVLDLEIDSSVCTKDI